MTYTAHGAPGSAVCPAELRLGSNIWLCTGTEGHADDHAAYGTDTKEPIKTWPGEQSDTQAALDLAATRWDNTRGYVAELEGQAAELAGRLVPEGPEWDAAQGNLAALRAVASFMDGQLDGSVTRG